MKNKVTVYMSDALLSDLKAAAEQQDRSLSWLIGHSWRLSRGTILGYPAVEPLDLDMSA